MLLLRYVSHPDVQIEPGVAVPQWHLSDAGRRRAQQMLHQPWADTIRRVVCSAETKAMETALILADHLGLVPEIRAATGEIDRHSTGFVPHERHEELAGLLYAFPTVSAAGWERAIDAQARIIDAVADLLVDPNGAETVIVGHGGVGTLLYCHLTSQGIGRQHDQPGQGHYFTVEVSSATVLHTWRPIDDLEST